jgi:hypothetical protein
MKLKIRINGSMDIIHDYREYWELFFSPRVGF